MKDNKELPREPLIRRIKGRIQRERRAIVIKKAKGKLCAEGFSIISQNCIGGVFYHDMGMKFLSPTIDLFFTEPDFVRFVLNLQYYIEIEPVMESGDKYPIGFLDDIEIHFMHYETCQEAKDAWEKRKRRINYDKILVIATDRNGFSDSVFENWKKIPYKKLLFTVNTQFAEEQDVVVFPRYKERSFVPDLIPDREFYKDDALIAILNSMNTEI